MTTNDDELQLDNITCITQVPEVYQTKPGDTTGTLWRPKNLTEVRARARKAGKRFFGNFGTQQKTT